MVLILGSYFSNSRSVKTKCFICKPEFEKLLRNYEQFFPEYDISTIEKSRSDDFFHGVYNVKESDLDNELGIFHVIQFSDELYVFTSSRSDFFDGTLNKIFKGLYPETIPIYIHSDEIFDILENFEQIKNLKLHVKKVVNKRIFGQSPRTGIVFETYKKDRIYPNFRDAFNFAKSNETWVDRIKVNGSSDNSSHVFQFSISRKGEVTIDTGAVDTIFTTILSQINDFGKERLHQFQGRSRREQSDKKPKPLIVKFGKKVFESLDSRHDFIDVLEKYVNCNYSVVHGGNPHVYLSVLDRNDNSSFSVRTLGNENLLLVPQIKTSAIALMRFSEFLITSFHEGVIQNYRK